MDIKTESLSLPIYEEDLPSYNEYDEEQNFIVGSSAGPEYIATYKVEKGGFLWSEYICKDYYGKQLRVKTKPVSSKLLIDDIPIMKIKNIKYHAKTINWDIVYTIKNPERYTKLTLTRSNFKLRTYFTLSLTKYDGEVVEYIILRSSAVPIRWTVYPKEQPNNIIIKYNFHLIHNSTLNQLAHIHEEDFKLFFLIICFILSYED